MGACTHVASAGGACGVCAQTGRCAVEDEFQQVLGKMLVAVRLTMKYWFDALEMTCFANLFVNQVDAAGDVLKHPRAMKEAFRLGAALADVDAPAPETPTDVELF
ncbi:unnamed protein product [marine sediment metagenome]|uniref:Uncharacterized protein n=1 Tax=marine sediment metagenome TaxID=412755 RepID=X0XXZ5_9ZZZZ